MKDNNIQNALNAFKDGKAALAQSKEQPDGTTRYFNVYGEVYDGWDHILNIFIDDNSIQQVLSAALHGKLKKGEEKDSKEFRGIEVTIDCTDRATTWLYRKTEEKVYLESYQRDYHKAFNDPDVDREWQLENGHLQLTKEALLEDDDLLYVAVFRALIRHLNAEGLTEDLRKLNKFSGAGILVTAKDEDSVSARIVQGDERPDLPCDAFLMGTIMCRPYLDEMLNISSGNEVGDKEFADVNAQETEAEVNHSASQSDADKNETTDSVLNQIKEDFDKLSEQQGQIAEAMKQLGGEELEITYNPRIEGTSFDLYQWSFTEGKEAVGKDWSIAIPDGFVIIDSEDRDFEAVPHGWESESSLAPVHIMAGMRSDTQVSGTDTLYHPFAKLGIAESIATNKAESIGSFLGTTSEVFGVGTDSVCAYALINDTGLDTFSYQCQALLGEKEQGIRVQTQIITKENKDSLTESIKKWLATFTNMEDKQLTTKCCFDSPEIIGDITNNDTSSFKKAVDHVQTEYLAAISGRANAIQSNSANGYINDGVQRLAAVFEDALSLKQFYCQKADSILDQIDFHTITIQTKKNIFSILKELSRIITEGTVNDEKVSVNAPTELLQIQQKWEETEISILQEAEEQQRIQQEAEERKREEEERIRISLENEKIAQVQERNSVASIIERIICVDGDAVVVVRPDGTVISCGLPPQLEKTVNSWTSIKQISMCIRPDFSTVYVVGLKRSGTVVCCGYIDGVRMDLSNWNNVEQIDVGYRSVYGRKKDGTCLAAGDNSGDQLKARTWNRLIKVSGAVQRAIGIIDDGTVVAVGRDIGGLQRINRDKDIIDISTCDSTGTLYALKRNGKVLECSSWDGTKELKLDGITTITKTRGDLCYFIGVDVEGKVHVEFKSDEKANHPDVDTWDSIVYAVGEDHTIVGVKENGFLEYSTTKDIPPEMRSIRLFNNFRSIKEDWKKEVQDQIKRTETELSNTKGLFSGGKRNALQNQIDRLKMELQLLDSE